MTEFSDTKRMLGRVYGLRKRINTLFLQVWLNRNTFICRSLVDWLIICATRSWYDLHTHICPKKKKWYEVKTANNDQSIIYSNLIVCLKLKEKEVITKLDSSLNTRYARYTELTLYSRQLSSYFNYANPGKKRNKNLDTYSNKLH